MIDYRYMAGLFDGEGCISLVKQDRVNSAIPTYSVRVVIAMTHKASKAEIDALIAEREAVRAKMAALKRVNHSVRWDDGEFGENPMPGVSAEGQSRAKQTTLKVVGRV